MLDVMLALDGPAAQQAVSGAVLLLFLILAVFLVVAIAYLFVRKRRRPLPPTQP